MAAMWPGIAAAGVPAGTGLAPTRQPANTTRAVAGSRLDSRAFSSALVSAALLSMSRLSLWCVTCSLATVPGPVPANSMLRAWPWPAIIACAMLCVPDASGWPYVAAIVGIAAVMSVMCAWPSSIRTLLGEFRTRSSNSGRLCWNELSSWPV